MSWNTVESLQELFRNEQGFQAIEFLGYFPIVLLVLLLTWYVLAIGYTGIVAANAAREGARAAATRENVEGAVQAASPGFDARRHWLAIGGYPCSAGGPPVTVRVRLETPRVLFPFIGALNYYPAVEQSASARCEHYQKSA